MISSIFKIFFDPVGSNKHIDPKWNCIKIQISFLLLLFLDTIYSESSVFNLEIFTFLATILFQQLFFSTKLYEVIAKPLTFAAFIAVTPISRFYFANGVFVSCSLIYILPLLAILQEQSIPNTIVICSSQIFYFYTICKRDLEPLIINTEQVQLFRILSTQLVVVLITIIIITLQIQRRHGVLAQQYREMKRKVKLLLGSVHDLKNSANILIGNVELCSIEPLPQSALQTIDNAKHCSKLLIFLTNNLLDLGKSDFRSLEINLHFVDLRHILLQNWRTFQTMLKRKHLQGSLFVASSLPSSIQIDSYRLSQVLFNIISNSEKYTDRGSIIISVDWIPNAFEIKDEHYEPMPYDEDGIFDKLFSTMSVLDDYQLLGTENFSNSRNASFAEHGVDQGILKITVKDTGTGISKENLKQLFKLYSQVSEDMSKRQTGSGLGLYISSEIISSLNGNIRCYSKIGVGTTLISCIPCKCRV